MSYKKGNKDRKMDFVLLDGEQSSTCGFKVATSSQVYNTHHIHIKGEITESDNYTDLIDFLYTVCPDDEVNIHINSEGGNLDTANEIVAAIQSCQATVNGHVNGFCASAATGILLACHNYIVGTGAIFMIHCLSAYNHGKLPEMMSYGDFLKKQGLSMLEEWYEGFLSQDEIKKVYGGKDIWLNSDELRERLIKRTEYHQKKQQEEEYSEIVATQSDKPN